MSYKSSRHRFVILSVCLSALFTLAHCATQSKLPADLMAPVVGENKTPHDIETIVILGTNDIHGALAPFKFKTKENGKTQPISYEKGGAAIFASHVRKLRSDFGSRLLVLDAGDEFQGTVESNMNEGAPMIQFFNEIGVNAATLGNHEFDFGPIGPDAIINSITTTSPIDVTGALKARMAEANFPYVSSNMLDKTTQSAPAYPNLKNHIILTAGRLKIGVFGLTTLETPTVTRPEYVRSLEFTSLKEAAIREAAALRSEGAQIVVALAHVGISCQTPKNRTAAAFRKPTDPQGACTPTDELTTLLYELPKGTLDAVVAGHSHQIVYHWVNGTPVIQGGSRNYYYNLIYLTYDWSGKKLLTERTRIEGPIPVCPKVFENQRDCNGDRTAPKNGRGDLVTPVFHGTKIQPDEKVTELLQPVFTKSTELKSKVIGQASRFIEHSRTKESELGNLAADALRTSLKADVGLVNAGGIRTNVNQGKITFEDVFRAFPFDNSVSLLNVTGKELKMILRVAENGARGFFPVSGVQMRLIDLPYDAPSNDLNGDKKIDPWEVNRILDIKFSDGTPIKDDKLYALTTVDFLVSGGDDFDWVMKQIPRERIKATAGPVIRDIIMDYVTQHSPLNSVERPLVDSKAPRLILEKKLEKSKKKRSASHKRSKKKR